MLRASLCTALHVHRAGRALAEPIKFLSMTSSPAANVLQISFDLGKALPNVPAPAPTDYFPSQAATHVRAPTMPDGLMPLRFWSVTTAVLVAGP